VLALAVRFRIPVHIAQGLLHLAAERRRVELVGQRLRRQLTRPSGASATQQLDRVQHLGTAVVPIMPTVVPAAGAGFLVLVRKLARDDVEPGELGEVLRGLRHNVTTEMDLELWALARTVRADARSAAAVRQKAPAMLAYRYATGALPPVLQQGLVGFLRRHGPHAVAVR
jgi:hypothetical protein